MIASAAIPVVVAALSLAPTAFSVVNYANDFVDPSFILDYKYNDTTIEAQQTIIQWANSLNIKAPWSVTTKKFLAPSGDKNDYMSWKPYQWPDCSQAGNTTVLSVDEMWKTCTYSNRDGFINDDARLINNVGDFDDMANAILFNSLAWGITRSRIYAVRVSEYINTWFVNPDTKMNPNLNYAQMSGGPTGQKGTHTGVLDLKAMAKVASGVLLLRQGQADGWNTTTDASFQGWVKDYIGWLTTDKLAIAERGARNNHGTFYFAQLAALYAMADDKANAARTAQSYFSSVYTIQIDADGKQPEEADRTRPFHYHAYNLAGIVTIGRIGQYAGFNAWDTTTLNGGNIQKAAEYCMNFPVGTETESELFPVIGAIAAIYGDSDNKYATWLNTQSKGDYVEDASFLWNQPLSDMGNAKQTFFTYAGPTGGTATLSAGVRPTGGTESNPQATHEGISGASSTSATSWMTLAALTVAASLF